MASRKPEKYLWCNNIEPAWWPWFLPKPAVSLTSRSLSGTVSSLLIAGWMPFSWSWELLLLYDDECCQESLPLPPRPSVPSSSSSTTSTTKQMTLPPPSSGFVSWPCSCYEQSQGENGGWQSVSRCVAPAHQDNPRILQPSILNTSRLQSRPPSFPVWRQKPWLKPLQLNIERTHVSSQWQVTTTTTWHLPWSNLSSGWRSRRQK